MSGTARIVLACALTLPAVLAQQTTGTITGRVVDEQGADIADATVTAANADTGFVSRTHQRRERPLPPRRARGRAHLWWYL